MRSFLLFLFVPLMFGSTNNCPNATASGMVSNGAASNSATTPGSPGNDLKTLGAAGCTAMDLQFSNFSNSTFSGTGQNGIGTLGGTYLAETPAGMGNNPLTNPDTLLFATATSGTNGNNNGNNNDGSNNWVTSAGG